MTTNLAIPSNTGATPPSSGAPLVIGRYAIYGEVASGGMATVHFASLQGAAGFARTVAVKRLHRHLTRDREFSLMFIDEARLAARIRHPNVVSTLDVVASDDEVVLVMEYVHGEALSKLFRVSRARNEQVPPTFAAAIMIDALHGLHAAHEATDEHGRPLNIVHRDVSPQNLLVGADGITRIADFGVAKAKGRQQETRDGSVKGKLAYMAPEQISGEQVTRVTDVFAASVVFWELLTGQRLFGSDKDGEIVKAILFGNFRPPSDVVPGLPAGLDAIVGRGLSLDPRRRYPTAKDMADDIASAVEAVRPAEIGAWVQKVAGDSLASRASVIAAMEKDASSGVRSLAATPQPETVVERLPTRRSSVSVAPARIPDAPTSKTAVGELPDATQVHTTVTPGRPRVQWPLVTVAAFALAAVAMLIFREPASPAQAKRAARTAPMQSAALAPAAPAASAAIDPAPTTPSPQPAPPSTGSAALFAPEPTVAERPKERPTTRIATPPSPPPPVPTATTKTPRRASKQDGCNPPYTLDVNGRKIFKIECM